MSVGQLYIQPYGGEVAIQARHDGKLESDLGKVSMLFEEMNQYGSRIY